MIRPAASSRLSLVGRDKEIACLRDLVSPPWEGNRALLLLGEPGLGKTALLTTAATEAESAGMCQLVATGRESEQELAYSGLHQLLRPALMHIPGLPARQAAALRGAFALPDGAFPPDALLTGLAVLTLLSAAAEQSPLLVTADDAQWMDQASLDALVFATRRLDEERVVILLSARGAVPPPGLERDFPLLLLEPLPLADAGHLLDGLPKPPRGRARDQVLAQAAGNPLALIELSKVADADPGIGRRQSTELLPPTSRLTAVMAARYSALSEGARAELLLAAAADSGDVTAHAGGLTMETLAQAEAADLLRVDASGAQFTHPLARSAVYHSAPFAERAAAHLKIAEGIRDRPDRHAWHLAAAALAPDEHVAALLEESAGVARRRGGAVAAARAMERAADLSPGEASRARRMLAAAQLAHAAGQSDWVRELAQNTLAVTSDQDLRFAARLELGWSMIWSGRNAEALETLLSVAADAVRTHPAIAWEAVGLTATLVHQTGHSDVRARVRSALNDLDAAAAETPRTEEWPASRVDEARSWVRACTDPFDDRPQRVSCLERMAGRAMTDPGKVGAAAWTLDAPELAVQVFGQALTRLRAPGVRGASGAVLSALQWACVDSGRWDEALAAAREAADISAAYKMEAVAANSHLTTAIIAAMRGESDQVAPLLARVLTDVDEAVHRGFAARLRHAAGLAALAQGRNVAAYAQLSREFAADGTPLHYQFSYYAIADFAAAAARAERRLEAAVQVERALATIGPTPGPRLAQLAARARGLLADPDKAERHFAAGLADPAGETWPFERAQLELDYAEWLRRRKRIKDARPLLGSAHDTFTRLGAAPWTKRADSELRACGVTAEAGPTQTNALDELTPQQREIAILAAYGLTNNEIADRLFLSPKTVASHLHRSYPKLGIAGRHQLHGLVGPAGLQQASG